MSARRIAALVGFGLVVVAASIALRRDGPDAERPQEATSGTLPAYEALELIPGTPTQPARRTPTSSSSSSSSSPPLTCRNSVEPSCGPFSWTAPPPPNEPATVAVRFEPAVPVAGETVVVHLSGTDPDGQGEGVLQLRSAGCTTDQFGICAGRELPRTDDCPEARGPWDPPVRPATPFSAARSYRVVFPEPGRFTYVAMFRTGPGQYEGRDATGTPTVACLPVADPFESTVEVDGEIEVLPPPPTETTTVAPSPG